MTDDGKKRKSIIKIIVFIGLILLIVLKFNDVLNILKKIYVVFVPLLLGAVMAFVLNILVNTYEKIYFPKSKNKALIKSRRGVCILLSFLTIILIIVFFLNIIIPQIAMFINLLVRGFPAVYDKGVEWALEHSDDMPLVQQKLEELDMNGKEVLTRSLSLLGNWTFGTVSFIGSAFGALVEIILAITFCIYILAGKEDLKSKFDKLFRAYVRKDRRKKLYEVLKTADETFSGYITGQCKEAVILGTLCTIGMLVLKFPHAKIIGPVMGLMALVPMVGAYMGAILGFILILTVDWLKAVMFILFIVVLQQIEGNLIYPKVVGESIGLPGIWALAAVVAGGGLMGIPGILFGVPLTATIYKLLRRSVNERLHAGRQSK
ncbi:MAG TPA: AI-2E family transporter [Clostridiales bacterium]|nr:AI-2E family transporter [Clostridiales bacterium]